jgi:hypothetical protein
MEQRQVLRANADDVHDPNVRDGPSAGPLVNRGGADTEQLRDLADREKVLDWR